MATKLGKIPKLHGLQFYTRYGDNLCMYDRVSGWVNSNMLTESLREKGVVIATKFINKSKNAQISVPYAIW